MITRTPPKKKHKKNSIGSYLGPYIKVAFGFGHCFQEIRAAVTSRWVGVLGSLGYVGSLPQGRSADITAGPTNLDTIQPANLAFGLGLRFRTAAFPTFPQGNPPRLGRPQPQRVVDGTW